ncbi:hypothetical protein EJB05_19190, partial [Eragrostis curvula]
MATPQPGYDIIILKCIMKMQILAGVLLFFLSLTIGSLLCWHIYLLCHNMTTIEYREAVRAKWLAKKSGQKYRHRFDLGMRKNIQMCLKLLQLLLHTKQVKNETTLVFSSHVDARQWPPPPPTQPPVKRRRRYPAVAFVESALPRLVLPFSPNRPPGRPRSRFLRGLVMRLAAAAASEERVAEEEEEGPSWVELEPICNEQQLDRALAEAQQLDHPIVLLWMASWCRKCIYLKPKLEKLAAEYHPRIRFYSVDVNAVPQKLVNRAGVTLWSDSQKQDEVIGGHKSWL